MKKSPRSAHFAQIAQRKNIYSAPYMVKLYNISENRLQNPRPRDIMAKKSNQEDKKMPWTNQERNRYQEDYKRENYDIIKVLTPKGTRERLKAEADRRGLPSVNALLNLLISSALDTPADPSSDRSTRGR